MGETRFIVAGSFIDGSGADIRRNVFLAIQDGIITAIGSAADLPRHAGEAIADFSHCVILPPLVDCSVSLSRSPSVDSRVRLAAEEAGPAERSAMLARHLRDCHAHGVLGVADSDDLSGLVARYREGLTQRSIINIRTSVTDHGANPQRSNNHGTSGHRVPQVAASGTAMRTVVREPGRSPQDVVPCDRLRTSSPLCRSSRDCAADNPPGGDFLKIGYSPDIGGEEDPFPRLGPEKLGCLLQQRGGRKAVVVANGVQQVAEALAAGCDAIEQGYGMGENNLRKMAEQGVLWIPSVLRAKNGLDSVSGGGEMACRFSTRYVAPGKPDPGAETFWQKTLAGQLAHLRLAKKLEVKTAVGTGAGSVGILHGESMAEEMKLFLKAGYKLEEAIRCATENGAGFFGMERLGSLTIGRKATFLIARGTVQQLPRKISYLEGIYVDGAPSIAYHKNPVKTA